MASTPANCWSLLLIGAAQKQPMTGAGGDNGDATVRARGRCGRAEHLAPLMAMRLERLQRNCRFRRAGTWTSRGLHLAQCSTSRTTDQRGWCRVLSCPRIQCANSPSIVPSFRFNSIHVLTIAVIAASRPAMT